MSFFASLLLVAYNYCTLSYTMAFWSEAEWTPELDRLEANGFNAALVTAGLPKVWTLTLREMGYSEERIKAFIPDSAAAAWWCMGNLEGLGGPVSDEYIERDAALGRWLCAEMRRRNIDPILQGFTGLVPDGTAGAVDQGVWCEIFRRPALLKEDSPDFGRFARAWYRNLEEVYGIKPKFLAGDLFHEGGEMSALDEREITATVRKVQSLQQEAFPGVVWMVQSWQRSPVKAVRDGLDREHTIIEILDKDMSNRGAYDYRFGDLPWIWCEILNFGGNTGLYGGVERFKNLDRIPGGSASFRGYGMMSEGLETNAYCYHLFLNKAAGRPEKATIWDFLLTRYGRVDGRLVEAIRIMERTVWNCRQRQEGCVENVMCAHPAFEVDRVSAWGPKGGTQYDRMELVAAAKLYLAAFDGENANYRDDLVEIMMQVLADKARETLERCRADRARRQEFLDLILLADALAECSDNWRLDRKQDRCRAMAGEKGAIAYRRMITTWATDERASMQSGLGDYAHRAYAGLLREYYFPRWKLFFESGDGPFAEPYFVREPTGRGDLRALAEAVLRAAE